MAEPLTDRVIKEIGPAAELYHRLILLVGPTGAGKTNVLQEVHKRTLAPLINVNLDLTRRMLDLTERQRALHVPHLLSEIVGAAQAETIQTGADPTDVVLLDNIEVLFDISLKQDPLRILQGLARNITLVVAWNGVLDGNYLVYAIPGHPEYKRYSSLDLVIVSAETAA